LITRTYPTGRAHFFRVHSADINAICQKHYYPAKDLRQLSHGLVDFISQVTMVPKDESILVMKRKTLNVPAHCLDCEDAIAPVSDAVPLRRQSITRP